MPELEKTYETGISTPEGNPATDGTDSGEETDVILEPDAEEGPNEISGTTDDAILPDEDNSVNVTDTGRESDRDTQK